MPTQEDRRLAEITDDVWGWRRWGPYVSDRAWSTVREDYSPDGAAWEFLPHDLARSKAYRWGEDAIAGLCDRYQVLVFAPAFWNEQDPLLKERLFGLTSNEGNHGEDVKEYYFHLDNTPTHSYMRFLYKYPQSEFPYASLIEENRRRAGGGLEFELLDTGVFADDRYFDIYVEYAKLDAEDICVRIEAINRGKLPAPLHIIPQLWFRNTWSWTHPAEPEPVIRPLRTERGSAALLADDAALQPVRTALVPYKLGPRALYATSGCELLFTNNETNATRCYGLTAHSRSAFCKDAFHERIVQGKPAVNPDQVGTKAGLHYHFAAVPGGGRVEVKLRLTPQLELDDPLDLVDATIERRRAEADEFYATIAPADATADEKLIQRQALAGLLWSKQCYIFDVAQWLDGDDPRSPPPESRRTLRNENWRHLNSLRVMTVPDKWEYPWFAAWDLAFQCVAFALVDPNYAMHQLQVLLFEQFIHPNGQIPAYEWEFSDLNPPVHAWAVWRVYNMARVRGGHTDRLFLERCFHKLLLNFTWWINRLDRDGKNIFEGGFLGLDNITVVDRSAPNSEGAVLEQSDATGWMGMFCLNMMRIALELARENVAYELLAIKFFQHYTYVAAAMKHMGGRNYQLWDEQDGFFYDVLRYPDGRFAKFRVRSLVGLIPLFAVERLEEDWIRPFHDFRANVEWFLKHRQEIARDVIHRIDRDGKTTYALTIVNDEQLTRILQRVISPDEFLGDYGARSLSKAHQNAAFCWDGRSVGYEPAESIAKIKGGNSNWRGPIWFPTCFLLIESLRKLAKAFGPEMTIESPHRGRPLSLHDVAEELANRLIRVFTRGADGRRPVYGGTEIFQHDPHWRDLILFFEYFHGDNGAGLGASHQTGWTALVASLIDEWR